MAESIYCAINQNNEIQWVLGSSKRTRYYKTDNYLKGAVAYHNKYHPNDPWRVAKFRLVCEQIMEEII